MKPLQLTEDQKAKLLEMCKVLFSEYPNLKVRNSIEDLCMEQDDCFIELQESGRNSRKDTIIHWFEFCTTELSKKLCNLYNSFAKLDWNNKPITLQYIVDPIFYHIQNDITIHPIDYLYSRFKEFKKLNK